MWTYKTELMRNIKPFAGGDLRLFDNQVMMMQVVGPVLEFKTPVSQVKETDPVATQAEFKEEWMNSAKERLNRMSVRILKGTLEKDVDIIFETKGQDGSWWISDDSQTIFLSSRWLDNRKINEYLSEDEYKNFTYFSLYKSTDAGNNFIKLEWPEHDSITQVLFTQDGQRGYIIGTGPSLWRTQDGGEHWQQILIPKDLLKIGIGTTALERYQNELSNFDAYSLDEQGNLLIAGFVTNWQQQQDAKEIDGSVIYNLPWNTDILDMNELTPVAFIPQIKITDIEQATTDELYLLTEQYNFADSTIHPKDKTIGFIKLQNGKEVLKQTFGNRIFLGKLYVGKDQLLYATGFTWTKGGLQDSSLAFVSKDKGKTWTKQDESKPLAIAVYFDAEHNTAWQLKTYSLYFRKI